MSQNLTQPEEIDRILLEMLGQDNKEDATGCSSDFISAASANVKPEFNRNCNQPGEPS